MPKRPANPASGLVAHFSLWRACAAFPHPVIPILCVEDSSLNYRDSITPGGLFLQAHLASPVSEIGKTHVMHVPRG
jgi:hypothetical protein